MDGSSIGVGLVNFDIINYPGCVPAVPHLVNQMWRTSKGSKGYGMYKVEG